MLKALFYKVSRYYVKDFIVVLILGQQLNTTKYFIFNIIYKWFILVCTPLFLYVHRIEQSW